MSERSRRWLLGAAGTAVVALAGCSQNDENSDLGDNDEQENQREEIVDSRRSIREDEYYSYQFDLNRQADLEYEFTVRDGPEIDVAVMTAGEFSEYESGNRSRGQFLSGTGGSDVITLSEGSYYFVLDNTNALQVDPPANLNDDVADVEYSAYVLPS